MKATKLLCICVLASSALVACASSGTAGQTTTTGGQMLAPMQAPPPQSPQPPPRPAPTDERQPPEEKTTTELPAGTILIVRTAAIISTEAAKTGSPFEGTLASPVRDASGAEIVPAGTRVFGQVVDARDGGEIKRPRLEVGLSAIEAKSRRIPIATTSSGAEGNHGGAIKPVGAGTLLGAAPTSAVTGPAVVLVDDGKDIAINRGTLIDFKLTQAVSLT